MEQHIFTIQKREKPYVILDKSFLQKNNLTMQAKGLLAYLLSLPDNWEIYRKELATRFKNGEKAITKSLKELIEHGYIHKVQKRDSANRFAGIQYKVYETPEAFDFSPSSEPCGKKPQHGKPRGEKGILISNNRKKNKKLSNQPTSETVVSSCLKIKHDLGKNGWVGDFDKLIRSLGSFDIVECYWNNHLSKIITTVSPHCRGGYISKRFASDAIDFYKQCKKQEQKKSINHLNKQQQEEKAKQKQIAIEKAYQLALERGAEKWQSINMEEKEAIFKKTQKQYDFIDGNFDSSSGEISGKLMQDLIYEQLGSN